MTILGALTSPVATVWNGVASQAWDPLVSLCRNGTLAQLQEIRIGTLALYELGGAKPESFFGSQSPEHPFASITVHDEKFWVRLALFADMVRYFAKLLGLDLRFWTVFLGLCQAHELMV